MTASKCLTIDNAEEILSLISVFVDILNYVSSFTPVFKFYLSPCAIRLNKNIITISNEYILIKNLCGWVFLVMAIILVWGDTPSLM